MSKLEFNQEEKEVILRNVGDEFIEAIEKNINNLKQVNVTVKIKDKTTIALKSNYFVEKTTADDYICDGDSQEAVKIIPNENLIKAFESLEPFISVFYNWDGKNYLNVKVVFNLDYRKVKATCPFCGRERDYVIHTIPYVYPKECECGAVVFSETGDYGDVYETIANMYPLNVFPRVEESENTLKTEDGKVVAVVVEKDEDEVDCAHVWLIFSKKEALGTTTN